ncbi:hypothetical protein DBV05_g11076 [Lasiodiplodia theobromae]|uniref:Heterokaryon incompatibility domain-containing protein n=1 Tax=Lasiodiplodia theobromae TaxID=45133 RepID=A0A5N5CY03_9PEZI|nr:hypothetical protein DBV05_g11076 [Lasiodiplodia theobromae]
MSVSPASADFKARVAKLQLCDCKRNWPDPHLTIELDHIPVQRGEATAIPYVWCEFDRRDVPIGHPPGKSEDIIRMNLGIEWVTQDVIHRLAEIAADKPIWMDQLCIPQNDEKIRRILANIATIYKTFDVAVLMPGHPCACLSLIVKELEARAAEEGKGRIPNLDDDIESYTPNFCLNFPFILKTGWKNREPCAMLGRICNSSALDPSHKSIWKSRASMNQSWRNIG